MVFGNNPIKKKLVFVTGTPRAGTSAMVNLLNCHQKMLIGQERFNFVIKQNKLDFEHFLKENFLKKKEGETHEGGGVHLQKTEPLNRQTRYDNAKIIGDKYPQLYRHYDAIFEKFPKCRIIYMARNPISVAESYNARWQDPNDTWYRSDFTFQKAIEHWNVSIQKTVSAMEKYGSDRFVVLEQESFFQSQEAIDKLFRTLGLKPAEHERTAQIIERANDRDGRALARENKIISYTMENADWRLYADFRKAAKI